MISEQGVCARRRVVTIKLNCVSTRRGCAENWVRAARSLMPVALSTGFALLARGILVQILPQFRKRVFAFVRGAGASSGAWWRRLRTTRGEGRKPLGERLWATMSSLMLGSRFYRRCGVTNISYFSQYDLHKSQYIIYIMSHKFRNTTPSASQHKKICEILAQWVQTC